MKRSSAPSSGEEELRTVDVPLDAVAHEAIERFARLMAACGFAPEAVSRAFADASESSRRKARPVLFNAVRELPEAPHIVTMWCVRPDYVDDEGRPRSLPARGLKRSVEALVRSVSQSLDVNEAIGYLLRTQTIRKTGRLYALNQRWISLRGVYGSTHFRSIRELVGMLRTLEHNLKAAGNELSWFEFAAENPRFPVSKLAAFDARLRREGMGFLRRIDAYMQRCEATRGPGERTVWLGLGMHRFQHDTLSAVPPPKRVRTHERGGSRRARRW